MQQHTFIKALGLGAFVILLWLFAPFLKSFCVALLMAMAISPLHRFFDTHLQRHRFFQNRANLIATSFVTLLFALILFLPLSLFLFQLFENPMRLIELIRTLGNQFNIKTDALPEYMEWLEEPLEKLVLLIQMHKDDLIALSTK
jgi:predicted PurR-regulated permease PerM